jgi:hypothetical protein
VKGCDRLVLWFTDNWIDGWKRKSFDDLVDKGWHLVGVVVGETGVVVCLFLTRKVVLVGGETGCCRLWFEK